MKIVHTSEMLSQGGREGKADAPDGNFSLQFGPTGDNASLTPESLFAGAYAACYHGAVLAAVQRAHLTVTGSTVIAKVSLHEDHQGGYYLAVELRTSLPGLGDHEALKIIHQAHQTCPYSKALHGNVQVTLELD